MVDWDARYAAAAARLYGDAPNEYVREVLARSDFNVRSALCLGDGDGRNGGWLTVQELAVTAIDISDVATKQARRHDRALGVAVERIVVDLAGWRPEAHRRWDAVFMIYLQCEAAVRHRAVARAAQVISPGGWFVAEGFARADGADANLGPKNADLLYDLPGLIDALPGFRIVEAFAGMTWLDEGERHRGSAHVARLLARRAND